jgi:hypothetical protein
MIGCRVHSFLSTILQIVFVESISRVTRLGEFSSKNDCRVAYIGGRSTQKKNTLYNIYNIFFWGGGEPLMLSGKVVKKEKINEIERTRVRSPPRATSSKNIYNIWSHNQMVAWLKKSLSYKQGIILT